MKTFTLSLTICALLLGPVESIERKRKEEAVKQCTISATGEEVCTDPSMDAVKEDKGSNHSDEVVFDEEAKAEDGDDECVDTHEHCAFWASLDECSKNPGYMLKGCPKSCKSCPNKMVDGLTMEQVIEKEHLLAEIVKYGQPQDVNTETQDKTMFNIRKTLDYMDNHIHAEKPTHGLSEETVNACRNTNAMCSYWATLGECDKNPSFMVTKCAPACLSCHKIAFEHR